MKKRLLCGALLFLSMTVNAEQQPEVGRQASLEQTQQLNSKLHEYLMDIQKRLTNNWQRPPTAQPGLRCKLKIIQIPGGEVISAANAETCNADEATRRSIIAAVERTESLPYKGYEDVFEREIDLIFTYGGD